ncbi:F0F1 ATP synthase subunit B [Streptacidiphilus fuscans]|uniref:ATP synthase subunit b n=1 Tax=Streptacidiphilus fuscans TaxID=2789292 RepID=A0A931B2R1_9ACTN|nr:F0F1 ATP synthase subunit B [Streptacidiphilus fuscans]MBF9069294.1 F0F1 ATP synthase subunit B [Streptacidiphilus fuscans]
MGPLNPSKTELVVALICFFTIYGILGRVLLPRARRVMDERADAIEGGMERAGNARREADAALEEYRLQLSEARREAARILQDAKEEGALLVDEARQQALEERERMIAAAEAEFAADRALVEASLRVAVADLSTELASKIVGEPLAELAPGSPAIRSYLDDLGDLTTTD